MSSALPNEGGDSRRRLPWIETLAVLVLILVTAAHSFIGEDIWFWDDAGYMARGINPFAFGAPGWVDSPLYSAWYALVSQGISNPIDLYLVVRASDAVIFILALWLAARWLAGPRLAWTVAAIASMLPVIYVWPGVATPASGFLVLAIALVWRWRSPLPFALATALVWLAAGSRPEFTWVAALASLLTIVWWTRSGIRGRGSRRKTLGSILVIASTLGLPVVLAFLYSGMFARSSREWTAFSQHFALRHPSPGVDTWQSAGEIAAKFFPGATSVLEALRVNPSAFFEHVARNALQLPVSLAGNALGMEPGSLLVPAPGKLAACLLLLAVVMSTWALRESLRMRVASSFHAAIRVPSLFPALLTISVIAGSFVALFVIYPRPHYLVLPIGLMLLACARFLTIGSGSRMLRYIPVPSTVILFGIFAIFSIFGLPGRIAETPPYESALRSIQEMPGRLVVISGDRPVELFLPGSEFAESPPAGAQEFVAALDDAHVNVVQLSPALGVGAWNALPGYDAFRQDPSRFGFRQPDPRAPLWIR